MGGTSGRSRRGHSDLPALSQRHESNPEIFMASGEPPVSLQLRRPAGQHRRWYPQWNVSERGRSPPECCRRASRAEKDLPLARGGPPDGEIGLAVPVVVGGHRDIGGVPPAHDPPPPPRQRDPPIRGGPPPPRRAGPSLPLPGRRAPPQRGGRP